MKRWLAAVALLALGCGDKKDARWVEQQEKANDEAKAKVKAERQKKEDALYGPKTTDTGPKDPFWDDSTLVPIENERACPEGVWALFPGKAPGTEKEEQKKNEAQRADLIKKLKSTRFVTHLKPPNDTKLEEYDAPKGHFPVTVSGLVDCTDSAGHLVIAFTQAKAITPPSSAAKQGAEVTLRIWDAKPTIFILPMKSMSDAKDWKSHHQFDLEARVVYTLGKPEVDRKMFKTSKVSSAGMTMGGGAEDWGAGRAIHAVVEGTRLTTDKGRTVLEDTRAKH
jgi:hypothetical protein